MGGRESRAPSDTSDALRIKYDGEGAFKRGQVSNLGVCDAEAAFLAGAWEGAQRLPIPRARSWTVSSIDPCTNQPIEAGGGRAGIKTIIVEYGIYPHVAALRVVLFDPTIVFLRVQPSLVE